MTLVLSASTITSSAKSSRWCVPFNFSPIWFSYTFLISYSKENLKSSGDKASPCFIQFWIGKLSYKWIPTRTSLHVSFKHILITLTSYMGSSYYVRILCNTFSLTES
jgi:hypothetical protein